MRDIYRHQVFVDEATDFSPIQLACMAHLSSPQIQSFFACGDFNQRLTTWGTQSEDEMHWIFSNTNRKIDIKKIKIAYRHSSQLNQLARSIVLAFDGKDQDVVLPKDVNNDCVSPVLLENTINNSVIKWLASRIQEIEKLVKKLPSIAVLVCDEQEVETVARDLNSVLEEVNIRAIACPKGQTRGQDTDVRVFDVQYIKGLEFEAVFFVGIDRLASLQSKLFDKYLYVGTTRAATYLGITCDHLLPKSLTALRHLFISNWTDI
ncbi:ATP-binding domain-containing protein [Thiospirillum jenense]